MIEKVEFLVSNSLNDEANQNFVFRDTYYCAGCKRKCPPYTTEFGVSANTFYKLNCKFRAGLVKNLTKCVIHIVPESKTLQVMVVLPNPDMLVGYKNRFNNLARKYAEK